MKNYLCHNFTSDSVRKTKKIFIYRRIILKDKYIILQLVNCLYLERPLKKKKKEDELCEQFTFLTKT